MALSPRIHTQPNQPTRGNMSSPPCPSSPQAQLRGAAAAGAARELATAPLPPLTSVLVVVRFGAGARVAALPHVVAATSDFLDYGLLQFWSLLRACEADLLSLLPRLVVRGVSTDVDPYYWKYQCGQGLVAAVKHDNLKMIKWLHLCCPCVLPYSAMVEAVKIGNLGLLQWFAARHKHIVWIPQMMDAAASTGQTEVLQWLYDRPNSHGCTIRIAFASAARGGHLDTVERLHDHYGHLVAKPLQAVHEAIRNGHTEVVKFVFRRPLPVQCEFPHRHQRCCLRRRPRAAPVALLETDSSPVHELQPNRLGRSWRSLARCADGCTRSFLTPWT